MPNWLSDMLGYDVIWLTGGEFAGILGGCIACILFAMIVDGHLAGSFLMGYGLAFATATIVGQTGTAGNIFLTYVGDGLIFVILAILLIAFEPMFSIFRKLVTEQRV